MITINHSGDGTTVDGTERGDTEAIAALKAAGFKWSRNLDGWFLPRTWREIVRKQRVDQLVKALGDRVTVEWGDVAKSATAEELAEAHKARAAELADKHSNRAGRLEAAADQHYNRSRAAVEGIPFGQPVLVGHHSQRRHERALDKSWNAIGKSVEASKAAELEASRAAASRREAEGYDQPARVGRRIETNGAELRRLRRSLAEDAGRNPQWAERITALADELEAKIERDKAVLAASGVAEYSRETVAAGDLVRIRGSWSIVDKANPKKVVITSHGLTLDYLYAEIQGHKRPTGDELRRVLESRHTRDLQDSLRSRRLPQATRDAITEVLAARDTAA